jgi:hypothetical protein
MEIKKMIEAKEKALSVIDSCENIPQLDVADRYVEQYFKKFEDELSYRTLCSELDIKKEVLNNDRI